MSAIFRTAAIGLGAAALVSFGLARSAAAQAPPGAAAGHNYIYNVAFNIPSQFLNYTAGDILFTFNPSGSGPVPASITAGNLVHSTGDWKLDTTNIGTFGSISTGVSITYPFLGPIVTITNAQPTPVGGPNNGFEVPVTQWGSSFGFTFTYADSAAGPAPPAPPVPSDFTLVLQPQTAGQPDVPLFDVRFGAAGAATLMSSAPGVTITPQGATPLLAPPAVPESSGAISLGLLLILGTGGVALARKRKA